MRRSISCRFFTTRWICRSRCFLCHVWICDYEFTSTRTSDISKDKCFFETEPESTTVLLIGDSQASTFSDPIAAAAKSLNLNFAVRYSRGCPIFPRPTVERPGYQIYLNALPGLIEHLNPEIIVIANATTL